VFAFGDRLPQAEAYLQLWLQALPLKVDEIEGQRVHGELVERVAKEHPGVLGAANCNLPIIIRIFASIYETALCLPETNAIIRNLFERLGSQLVMSTAESLNKSQRRAVGRIFKAISQQATQQPPKVTPN